LSDDIKKLGEVPLLLYKWIKLHSDIHNEELPICKYIPKEVYDNLNFYRLNQIRNTLKNVPCNNLEEFIIKILNVAHESNEVRKIIKRNIGDDFQLNIELIKNVMRDSLYSIISDEDILVAESNICAILQLDFFVMKCWYDYLMREITSRVQFHTFHGTKGLEYKNVIIVLTNSFNRKRDYYHKYFQECSKEESYSDEEFVLKRNLLYVAVTRTKVNLRLLYVDSGYDSVKDNFENIFGEAVEYVAAESQ
jgi:DNA helicase-2/ATP-dependent DNA helicase PcrA